MIRERLSHMFARTLPLKIRLYFIVLLLGIGLASVMTVINLVLHAHWLTSASSIGCTILLIVLLYYTQEYNNHNLCALIVGLSFNLIIFPVTFLSMGAIDSGAFLYFPLGIILTGLFVDERLKRILIYLFVVFDIVLLYISSQVSPLILDTHTEKLRTVKLVVLVVGEIVIIGEIILHMYRDHQSYSMDKPCNVGIYDVITKVYNEDSLLDYVEKAISICEIVPFTLGMFEIEDYMEISTQYEKDRMDNMLRVIAETISLELKDMDFLARYQENQFVVVFYKHTKDDTERLVKLIQEKIIIQMNQKLEIASIQLRVGVCESNLNCSVTELLECLNQKKDS